MELFWILSMFFAFITIAFVAIALFFPEWVGITGKKAKAVQRHLQGAEDLNENTPSAIENNSQPNSDSSSKKS